MKRRDRIRRFLHQCAKFALRFLVHPRPVQSAVKLAPLQRARVAGKRRRRSLPANRKQKRGVEQSIQRLPHFKLTETRVADQSVDVAMTVEERNQRFLLWRESVPVPGESRTIDAVDDIEAWYFLFDQRPLVHPPRALEQQRLWVDRNPFGPLFRLDAGLEVEGAACPREQRVNGVLGVERTVDNRGMTD